MKTHEHQKRSVTTPAGLRHEHRFNLRNEAGELRTKLVVGLTLVMMVAEIGAGWAFGSMALLADGWHMGTHAAALGITLFAYWYARRHEDDRSFTFGTGKVGSLGGFASSVGLAIVALAMVVESVRRLIAPEQIRFDEAILVAGIGLVVNLVSALMLKGSHGHSHSDGHDHGHDHAHAHAHGDHGGEDHNLKAAYLHVLADALTSVAALVALVIGRFVGWVWLDAVMGIVGAAVILRWSVGVMRDTSAVLLDRSVEPAKVERVRDIIESCGGTEVADLHVWRLGPRHCAAEVSLVAGCDCKPGDIKQRLAAVPELAHLTIEVNEG